VELANGRQIAADCLGDARAEPRDVRIAGQVDEVGNRERARRFE
jgi:hypothetical protein